MHLPLQRPRLVHLDLERIEGQRIAAVRVQRLQIAHAQRAVHAQRGVRGLLERQLEIGIDRGRLQPQRQAGRQVAQVGCQVEPGQPHRGAGALRCVEGQRLGLRVEGAAVERKGQPRLHRDLARRRQVADEGHGQLQAAHLLHALDRAVVEVDAPVFQGDVVERKTRRLARLCRLGPGRKTRQDVVDVVVALAQVRQAQCGLVHLQRVQHGRQLPDRLQRGIGVDALDAEQIGRAGQAADGHVVHRQLQRPGLEVHPPDVHRPPELLAADLLALPLEQRRHTQPTGHAQGQHHGGGDQRAAQPAAATAGWRPPGRHGVGNGRGIGGFGRHHGDRLSAQAARHPPHRRTGTRNNRNNCVQSYEIGPDHRPRAPKQRANKKARRLPAGLSGSVTKASWSAWIRIGKLAVPGCGEGNRLPSSGVAGGCHAAVSRPRTGSSPTGASESIGQRHCRGLPAPAPVANFNATRGRNCPPQSRAGFGAAELAGTARDAFKSRAAPMGMCFNIF